ncbi:MAG: right-handed parallel beta-helix repeat-containing protein, partial [Planctomycetota bacterium]
MDGSTLVDCAITGNEVVAHPWYHSGGLGGGIYCESSATIVNCLIADNASGASAGGCGGGICFSGRRSSMIGNCTIADNWNDKGASGSSVWGRGIYGHNYGGHVTVMDSVIWKNDIATGDFDIDITYSDVRGAWPGEGNIDADPCFVSGPLGNYYLSQVAAGQVFESPCVDAGSDTAVRLGLDQCTTRTDAGGDEGIVDMGYHYGNCGSALPAGDIDEDGDVD